MVRRRITAPIVLLPVIALLMLTACTTTCTSHSDADKNGKCDACGETVCTSHSDTDEDGKCDACGETVETVCTSHSDTDEDGKCDACDEIVETVCTSHSDTDEDGRCDACGEDVQADEEDGDGSAGGELPGDIDLPLDPFV